MDRRLTESIRKKKAATLEDTLQYLEEAQADKNFLKLKVGKATCLEEEDPTYTLLTSKLDQLLEQGKEIAGLKEKMAAAQQQKPPGQGCSWPQKAVKCYRCRKKSHMARDCQVNLSRPRPQPQAKKPSSQKEKCKRCRQMTTTGRNCRAGLSKKPC